MADPVDPFLSIVDFAAEYPGTLDNGERTTATRLLQVVSDGIRGLKPDVNEDAAAQVVFEVVRDDLMYGHLGPLSSFQNITSRRTEAGTFDAAARINAMLTHRQKSMLGIATTLQPLYNFPENDY